jgi:hypothetical protein
MLVRVLKNLWNVAVLIGRGKCSRRLVKMPLKIGSRLYKSNHMMTMLPKAEDIISLRNLSLGVKMLALSRSQHLVIVFD